MPVIMVGGALVLLSAGVLAGHLHHQKASAALRNPTTTAVVVTLKGSVLAKTAPVGCASAPNGIKERAVVNVADSVGAVLATSVLGPGLAANGGGCTWSWTALVPSVADYQIQVGGLPVAGISRATLAHQAYNFYENDTTDSSQLINIESGV
ncbi:MAG: hypothetical protein ACYCTI_10065 [Acidimicrobiales bacterium]